MISGVVQENRGTSILHVCKCSGVVQGVIQDIMGPGVVKCTGLQEQYSVTEVQE